MRGQRRLAVSPKRRAAPAVFGATALAVTALAVTLLAVTFLAGLGGAASAASPADTALRIDDAEPRVTVALSPAKLTVGDRVTAVVTLTAPRALLTGEPRFPYWEQTWGRAEVLEVNAPESLSPRGGVATFRQRLVLAAFRPGEVRLPPRDIGVPLASGTVTATTPEDLSFRIAPVLPPSAQEGTAEGEDVTVEPDLRRRAEEPPRPLPLTARFWWASGVTACACLALAFLLWARLRTSAAAPEATLGPLERFERELEAVSASPSSLEGHARLSRALRRYLGRRLGFPAPESTTTEIRRDLEARRIPEQLIRGTAEVLGACDLVKFARRTSTAGGLDRHVQTAHRVGRELERHLRPPDLSPRSAPDVIGLAEEETP